MARSRNIKPGFFKNEDLAECSPWARLCFAGLWTLADREGRLEDRPKRIKGDLFPFDSIEVEPLLVELTRYRFIVRYEGDDVRVIQIVEFLKHQNPHFKEAPSVLPSIESLGLCPDGTAQMPKADPALNEGGASGKPGALGSIPSISSTQNPADSLTLIPDSLTPHSESKRGGDTRAKPEPGENDGGTGPQTHAGTVCKALKAAGIARVSPSNPTLQQLIAAGATQEELVDLVPAAIGKADPFSYLLTVAVSNRTKAAQVAKTLHRGPLPQPPPGRATATERRTATVQAFTGQKVPHERPDRSDPDNTIDVAARVVP